MCVYKYNLFLPLGTYCKTLSPAYGPVFRKNSSCFVSGAGVLALGIEVVTAGAILWENRGTSNFSENSESNGYLLFLLEYIILFSRLRQCQNIG